MTDRQKYKHDYYELNKDMILADMRKRRTSPEGLERNRASARAYYVKNAERVKARQRIANKVFSRGNRDKLLAAMGNSCVRCGFDDYRALQIDHVNGGGRRDKLISRVLTKIVLEKRIEQFKNGELQLLCANCNWIKRAENGETRKVAA